MPRLNALYSALRLVGIWPPENYDRYYVLKMEIVFSVLLYQGFGIGLSLVNAMRNSNKSVAEKSEALFFLCGYYNMVYNYMVLFSCRRDTMKLFRSLEDFNNFGRPENLDRVAKYLNIFSFCFLCYTFFGSLTVCLFSIQQYERCTWINEIKNISVTCGTVTRPSYPYNISKGLLSYAHILLETYAIVLAHLGGGIIVYVGMSAFEFIIVRIDHLKIMLGMVFLTDDEDERKNRFRECVMYHIYILELSAEINNCFETLTSPALINYSISIGSTLLAFLTGHSLTAVINVCGWIIGIFFMCIAGQRIQDKSLSVADAAYDMRWYTASPRLRKDIHFMIFRAEKPIKYRCGALGDFHFETFKNIMSTAYRFSTVKTGVS